MMTNNRDFLNCAIAFITSVDADIQQNLKRSNCALRNGDEDTADYYATRALAQKQVYDKFIAAFSDLFPEDAIATEQE